MRILKIIHGYPPQYNAGSEVYSQSLCHALRGLGHEVAVFAREEDEFRPDFDLRQWADDAGIVQHRINMARGKDGYRHRAVDAALGRVVAAMRPQVAHIGHLNHLSTGIVDALAAAGVPVVFTLHDFWLMCPRGQFLQRNFTPGLRHALCPGQDDHRCASTCYAMMHSGTEADSARDLAYWTHWVHTRMAETRRLCSLVDAFVAPSRYLMGRFVDAFGLPAHKIRYIDYGFPMHYLTPAQATDATVFTFGYIGTHIPAKGVDMLIGAFRAAFPAPGRAALCIWGRDMGQATAALRQLAEGAPHIAFMGEYVNQHLASQVFAHVHAIVVPSIWGENSPLVIHEAQACRVPVITADFGGMAEYVRHGVNGLTFAHRDPAALQAALEHAAGHPAHIRQLGQRGYLHQPHGHVPDIIAHALTMLDLYESLQP